MAVVTFTMLPLMAVRTQVCWTSTVAAAKGKRRIIGRARIGAVAGNRDVDRARAERSRRRRSRSVLAARIAQVGERAAVERDPGGVGDARCALTLVAIVDQVACRPAPP